MRHGRGASRCRRRVRTGRAISRRPDDALATRAASLARLVAALEVGCARVALGVSVVPHRAAAHRAQRHAGRVHAWATRGWGWTCRARRIRLGRRTCGARSRAGGCALHRRRGNRRTSGGRRCSGRPDHPVATAVLALEVRRLGIPLPLAIVPHRASTSRAVGNGGRIGRHGIGHATRRVKEVCSKIVANCFRVAL